MLPPEVLRIVLLIGLAATGYLMILAWNDDREQSQSPVTYSDAPVLSDGSGEAPVVASEPISDPSPGSLEDSDIPDDSLLIPSAGTPAQESAVDNAPVQQGGNDRLVKVTTPSQVVWIDRLGGDVVRVQLPGYPVSLDQPDVPYQLLESSPVHTYVAQSGLMGPDGTDGSGRARPLYSAPSLEIDLTDGGQVVLLHQEGEVDIRKVFTFRADDHLIDMRYEMDNTTDRPLTAALFAQIKRDDRRPPSEESFALAPQPYLGAAITTPEERYMKVEFEDVEEQRFEIRVEGGWVAMLQHYFLSAWVAPQEALNNFYGYRGRDGLYRFGFTSQAQVIAAGETGVWQTQFYAGPKDQKRLEEIAPNLNLTIDYGFLWWLAIPLFWLLDQLHGMVGNWGVAIILLTVVVKLILYPLSAAGYKSMANMRRVAPAMKRLQERYANDREKLSREMMALYKKEGANPLGGCLPMLLPMPIFIALYWVLLESVELRQAPFFLWIEDLSKMDPFFVLPLLMGASMYWMQSLSPQMGDPMQQKMMKMMPIMFTVLFLFFPAGLVLYWLVNNVLSVAQQQFVYRQADKAKAA